MYQTAHQNFYTTGTRDTCYLDGNKYSGYSFLGAFIVLHVLQRNILVNLVTYMSHYGQCSKISNFLFSNKMLVVMAGIHKMLGRIANREEPDQTASSEAV